MRTLTNPSKCEIGNVEAKKRFDKKKFENLRKKGISALNLQGSVKTFKSKTFERRMPILRLS